MIALITKLFQQIWKAIDVILYFAGMLAITFGAFLINKPLGYIVGGIALFISGYLIDLIVANNGKGGGK